MNKLEQENELLKRRIDEWSFMCKEQQKTITELREKLDRIQSIVTTSPMTKSVGMESKD